MWDGGNPMNWGGGEERMGEREAGGTKHKLEGLKV